MNQAPVRQLSAIMFADIVGYTAMMQRSEADAVARRDRFREVLIHLVQNHHGTVVQHYGDGTLAIFPSAVEATTCALMIQRMSPKWSECSRWPTTGSSCPPPNT